MFKKFFAILTICLGLFSSVAFASTVDTSKYNYSVVASDNSFKIYFNQFDSAELYGSAQTDLAIYLTDAIYYNISTDTFGIAQSGQYKYILTAKSMPYTTNNYDLALSIANYNFGGSDGVIPPAIAPTVMEAIQGLLTQFLTQLGVYLPIGVLLLAIILVVSLIPRFLHLFL